MYAEALTNVAFNVNLRRYMSGSVDWSGAGDLFGFLALAAEHGLFVNLRVGGVSWIVLAPSSNTL